MTIQKLFAFCALAVSLLAAADRPPSDQFYDAIRANDLPAVSQLLKSGLSVDTKDARGGTPLHYAAAVGSVEAMRELIAAGANVNARTSFQATPLMWCAADPDKVKLLVEKGADVNARSQMGHTPLNIAAAHAGSVETVRYLLDKGAALSKSRNELGMTPLLRATMADDPAIAGLLLEKGDDPKIGDGGARTPLMFAAEVGNAPLVRMLLAKGADVNAQSTPSFGPGVKNGPIAIGSLTALILAASSHSAETVRLLLDAGADVNARDVRGMTPVMLAVATDHPDESIVKMLLAKKPAMDVKSKAGETTWAWAAKFQHPAILPLIQTASAALEPPRIAPVSVERAGQKDSRVAAERALALMQKTDAIFLKNGGCFSCHAQNITTMAAAVAREKKIPFDQPGAAELVRGTKLQFAAQVDGLLERFDPPASIISSIALVAMGFDGAPADRVTDALVINLAAQQSTDGRWVGGGGVQRPPTSDGDLSNTALSMYALRHYAPPARKVEFDRRIAKAAAWVIKAKTVTTEDSVMQLLGARWSGADAATIERFSRQVLALQRQDGGWAQTPLLKSDAYATGTALYALHAAGRPVTDAAFHRGVQFLLETQAADGSWYVASRAPKFQPYFDGGFPYGHDQWISQWATGWAALVLSL